LEIVLVRKIGVPWQPELALGAVVDGANPQVLINDILAAELAIDQNYITSETARQLEEIERRRKVYLGDRTPLPLAGRTVIVVDDGIATGAARYEPRFALSQGPERGKSSSRSRSHLRTRSKSCERRSTRLFA